jgi:hypothetical protein
MTLPCVPIFLATSRCSPHDWFSSLTTIVVHVDHASVQHIRDLSNHIDTTVWHRPQLHRRTRLTLPDSMRWIQHMHEHANHRTLMRHTHHQLNKHMTHAQTRVANPTQLMSRLVLTNSNPNSGRFSTVATRCLRPVFASQFQF